MRQSLIELNKSLEAKGLTLDQVIDMHIEDVNKHVNKEYVTSIDGMSPRTLEKYKKRFDKGDLSIAKIIECSVNLAPMIAYQKRVKAENKKRQQEKIAEREERRKL